MYSGLAYTIGMKSATFLKLRSAWMPPDVAHAPMVISSLGRAANRVNALFVVRGSDGTFHKRNIVGAFDDGAGASGKLAISTAPDNG